MFSIWQVSLLKATLLIVHVIFLGLGDFKPHEVCWEITVSCLARFSFAASPCWARRWRAARSCSQLPLPAPVQSPARVSTTPWATNVLEWSVQPEPPDLPRCWVRGWLAQEPPLLLSPNILCLDLPPPSEVFLQDSYGQHLSPSLPIRDLMQNQDPLYLLETHSLLRDRQTKIDMGNVCIITPS